MEVAFDELKRAANALGSPGGSYKDVMMSLIKLKESKREFVSKLLESTEKKNKEKDEAEALHLLRHNLLFKRENLLNEIAKQSALKTPFADQIAEEMDVATLSTNVFEDMEKLTKKHNEVLKLLLKEQLNRQEDKLALEKKLIEHHEQTIKLDNKRKFIDQELRNSILEVQKIVEREAPGFAVQNHDEEEDGEGDKMDTD
jgi:hypothetical protein